MDSFWNINFLIACQLFAGVVPGFCRSPILHLGELGEQDWEEHRIVSSHSQASVPNSQDAVDDCKAPESRKVGRSSVWIENDYFDVDEEERFELTEEQAEVSSSFLGSSLSKIPLLPLQKSGMGYGRILAVQTVFSGAEAGTKNNNIVEFLENRGYAVPETAAGA
ncbi:MAG: hypothetical protein ACRC4G_02865 [Alphaproteobacteria bacterium]